LLFFLFVAEDGIRGIGVTGVQTCALPICRPAKIGGTMCYNGRGRGYVVSGSRYLIHYR